MIRCDYFDPISGITTHSEYTRTELEVLSAKRGDGIGVVLLMPGAPETRGDVHAFLMGQYIDESGAIGAKLNYLRGILNRLKASRKLTLAVDQINEVGGGVSLNLLSQDQATALTNRLRRRYGAANDVFIKTYVAARYGSFTAEKAVAGMRADGINKIILVPMFPSYAATLSDFSSEAWSAFRPGGAVANMDRIWVTGALSNTGFVQAVHDRIDYALQRFPLNMKDRIHVVFVARWSGSNSWRKASGIPPSEVVSIVNRITTDWQHDFEYSIGRMNSGLGRRLDPNSVRSVLRNIREAKKRAVLVVPIDHSSDQIDSAYRLDVVLRKIATEEGISHFKVASPVNCHPNFIQALTEKISARIEFEGLKSQHADRAAMQSENGVTPASHHDEKYV